MCSGSCVNRAVFARIMRSERLYSCLESRLATSFSAFGVDVVVFVLYFKGKLRVGLAFWSTSFSPAVASGRTTLVFHRARPGTGQHVASLLSLAPTSTVQVGRVILTLLVRKSSSTAVTHATRAASLAPASTGGRAGCRCVRAHRTCAQTSPCCCGAFLTCPRKRLRDLQNVGLPGELHRPVDGDAHCPHGRE